MDDDLDFLALTDEELAQLLPGDEPMPEPNTDSDDEEDSENGVAR